MQPSAARGAAADADVRLVRSQASRLAAALHGRVAGLPHPRRRPLHSPAALCRRFRVDHLAWPSRRRITGTYDISGPNEIDYGDLIRTVQGDRPGRGRGSSTSPTACSGRCSGSMHGSTATRPSRRSQLEALVIPEMFPVIDWPAIFGVTATPLRQALEETYLDPALCARRAGLLSGGDAHGQPCIGAGRHGAGGGPSRPQGSAMRSTVVEADGGRRRHGGAFRLRRPVDRALLPLRLQGRRSRPSS